MNKRKPYALLARALFHFQLYSIFFLLPFNFMSVELEHAVFLAVAPSTKYTKNTNMHEGEFHPASYTI
jgi:hypothetical protein